MNKKRFSVFVAGTISACLIGGGIAVAQTKQLKTPKAPANVATNDSSSLNAQTQTIVADPNGGSSSYSVVIENKTTPDGNVVQSRKVWQNGQLVEEEEKTLDANEVQNGLSTIQLPNGQIALGGIFSSEDANNVLGVSPSSPLDAIRQMEEQMRAQQEQMRAQFEALRQQWGLQSQIQGGASPITIPGLPNDATKNVSKFWIGTNIESVPEFLLAQLPLEEEQGVWVQFVVPESPAAKAGLKRFDVIYKIGDQIVSNPREVSELVEKLGNQKTTIEYYRKGKLEKGEITIEERTTRLPNSKSFRIVRPGLIVPSTEADSQLNADKTIDNQTGTTSETEDANSSAESSQTQAE